MKLLATTLVLFSTLSVQAMANELDPGTDLNAPNGLIVRIDAQGNRDVFKGTLSNGVVDNTAAAKEEISTSVNEGNKIDSVTPLSELDQVSSDESWHWSWNGSGNNGYYSYNRHCGNSYSTYYPSYSYYNGGYQYNYYYSPVRYGYHSGYYYDDHYGYHHGHHGRRGR